MDCGEALRTRGRMANVERRLELWAVVLISVASLMSAWCAYQSARWGSAQAQLYARANASRAESLRQSGIVNRQTMVDINLFVNYERALFAKDQGFAAFIAHRFPARLKTAVQAWLATNPLKNENAPTSPFVMQQYHLQAQDQADDLESQARSSFEAAVNANETGDRYILMTVLFASVSFLAGVGSKFDSRSMVMVSLVLGSVVLLVAGAVLTGYPSR
jgi:hypothetical protein